MSAEYVEAGFIEGAETASGKANFHRFRHVLELDDRIADFHEPESQAGDFAAFDQSDLADSIDLAFDRPYDAGKLRMAPAPRIPYANDMLSDMEAHGIRSHCEASSSR